MVSTTLFHPVALSRALRCLGPSSYEAYLLCDICCSLSTPETQDEVRCFLRSLWTSSLLFISAFTIASKVTIWCSYLEWQLNIEPGALKGFESMFAISRVWVPTRLLHPTGSSRVLCPSK